MAKFALCVELKARKGLESEVEKFLNGEAALVRKEPGTLSWHASKDENDRTVFIIFDTFNDEASREAHLNGEAGAELVKNAERLFSEAPKIYRLQVVAQK